HVPYNVQQAILSAEVDLLGPDLVDLPLTEPGPGLELVAAHHPVALEPMNQLVPGRRLTPEAEVVGPPADNLVAGEAHIAKEGFVHLDEAALLEGRNAHRERRRAERLGEFFLRLPERLFLTSAFADVPLNAEMPGDAAVGIVEADIVPLDEHR